MIALAIGLSLLVDAQLRALEHNDLLAEVDKLAQLRVMVDQPLVFSAMHVLVAEGKLLDAKFGNDDVLDDVWRVPEVKPVLNDVASPAAIGAATADPAAQAASATAATVDVVERRVVGLHVDHDELAGIRIQELLQLVEAVVEETETRAVRRPVRLLTCLLIEYDAEAEVKHTDAILQLLLQRSLLTGDTASKNAVTRVVRYVRRRVVRARQHQLEERNVGKKRHPS